MPYMLDDPDPNPSHSEPNDANPDDLAATMFDVLVRSEEQLGIIIDIASFDRPVVCSFLGNSTIVDPSSEDTVSFEYGAALQRRTARLLADCSEGERLRWDCEKLTMCSMPAKGSEEPGEAKSVCCVAAEVPVTSDEECECGCGKVDWKCEVLGKCFRVMFFVEDGDVEKLKIFRSEKGSLGVGLNRQLDYEDLQAWDRAVKKGREFVWDDQLEMCPKRQLWLRVSGSFAKAVENRVLKDKSS